MTDRARALMPDYLRLVALFGIVVVNIQFIAFPMTGDPLAPVEGTVANQLTMWLINGFTLLKTYGLFSFMFGVGLGFLMRAAERRGLLFGRLYRNRMIGLIVLGILHGCLFFPGDILVVYGITGAVLYLLRHWSVRRLVQTGAGLLIFQMIIVASLLIVTANMPDDMPDDIVAFEAAALTQGGFLDAVFLRTIVFAFFVPFVFIFQGISVLGWFCLGLAAVKSGMIDRADHPLWARARRFCLGPGVGLSLLGAGLLQWGSAVTGEVIMSIAAPLATLGYLGVIAALARPPGPVMARILAAGGSSLTIYLGQSIALSSIFAGYGLGLWDQVDHLTAAAIALLVTVLLIAVVMIWRIRFKLGPFEWILRRITYAGARAQ